MRYSSRYVQWWWDEEEVNRSIVFEVFIRTQLLPTYSKHTDGKTHLWKLPFPRFQLIKQNGPEVRQIRPISKSQVVERYLQTWTSTTVSEVIFYCRKNLSELSTSCRSISPYELSHSMRLLCRTFQVFELTWYEVAYHISPLGFGDIAYFLQWKSASFVMPIGPDVDSGVNGMVTYCLGSQSKIESLL